MAHLVNHCTFELGDEGVKIGSDFDGSDLRAYFDHEDEPYLISTFWQLDSDERKAILDGARIVVRLYFNVAGNCPAEVAVEGAGIWMTHSERERAPDGFTRI